MNLFENLETVRDAARGARRLFLFFDFDGTLAPIRSRPEHVWIAPGLRRLLHAVGRSNATVAVISGRALRDVRRRVGVAGIWYAGAHGFFLLTPYGRKVSLLTSPQRARIISTSRALQSSLRSLPGIQIEHKEATIAVHYRRATASRKKFAWQVLQEIVGASRHLEIMHGKKVWEVLPATRIDKWTAVRAILLKEKWRPREDLLFFFGDDTTDEAVFRQMEGFSVAVAKQKGTAAHYFVRTPEEVARFLKNWKELTRPAAGAR
jgi:trehalose-phosphatase